MSTATTNQIKLLDLKLGDPNLYAKDQAQAISLGKDKAKLEEKIVALEAEWMSAAEVYENAKAEAGV